MVVPGSYVKNSDKGTAQVTFVGKYRRTVIPTIPLIMNGKGV